MVRVLLLFFQYGFLLFLFLFWFLWPTLLKLCWIVVVRVGTLVLFLTFSSVQFSHSVVSDSCPSNEYPGLISFRMDWLDLLADQGTLKSLLQHHSSKASILLHSAFFTVQLLHPYMTTGKTIALTRRTFVGKVMSLLRGKDSSVPTNRST